jgi:ABC-2 type transport system permease protein
MVQGAKRCFALHSTVSFIGVPINRADKPGTALCTESLNMNWYGLYTLFGKEVWRFLKVAIQTILTPIITVLLYLLVFASVLSKYVEVYEGVSYTAFLIPGLIMMSIIQNAFANSSSSLFQLKMMGSLVFILLPPLSSLEFYLAFVGAAVLRGLLVGLGVWIATMWFVVLPIYSFWTLLIFSVLGSAVLGIKWRILPDRQLARILGKSVLL